MGTRDIRARLLLIVSILSVLALIWGCSGDDDRVITPSKPSAQDSAFIETLFGPEIVAAGYQTIPVSLALVTQIPAKHGPVGLPKSPATLPGINSVVIKSIDSYTYANGWHIFSFGAAALAADWNDTLVLQGTDSIKILSGGLAVAHPDSATAIDMLIARVHVAFRSIADGATGSLHHADTVSLAYTGDDTLAVINGRAADTSFLYFDTDGSRCEVELRAIRTVTDLRTTSAAEAGDCPLGGTVAMRVRVYALSIEMGKPPADTTVMMNETWTLDAVVADDHSVTITYSNGVGSWSRISDCKGPDASPIKR